MKVNDIVSETQTHTKAERSLPTSCVLLVSEVVNDSDSLQPLPLWPLSRASTKLCVRIQVNQKSVHACRKLIDLWCVCETPPNCATYRVHVKWFRLLSTRYFTAGSANLFTYISYVCLHNAPCACQNVNISLASIRDYGHKTNLWKCCITDMHYLSCNLYF